VARQHDDYYTVLGVGRGATDSEIDRAYRRAARATHPDVHPDDTSAGERFNAVAIAYETLSNPERRASYDRAHSDAHLRVSVRVVVHRHHPRGRVAPVHLGRAQPEPPRPLTADPTTAPGEDDLFVLLTAFSRLINHWPFP
jgi:preprotein translocase subunit Sec63